MHIAVTTSVARGSTRPRSSNSDAGSGSSISTLDAALLLRASVVSVVPVHAEGTVEGPVGDVARGVGHAVVVVVERGGGDDVVDILVGEAVRAQGLDVRLAAIDRVAGDLHRVVQHGAGAGVEA